MTYPIHSDEICRLRHITSYFLTQVEEVAKLPQAEKKPKEYYEQLWGKGGVIAALARLTQILLKLENAQAAPPPEDARGEDPLEEGDEGILGRFQEKSPL